MKTKFDKTKNEELNKTDVISSLFGIFSLVRYFKILYLTYLILDYKTCAEMPHVKHSKYLYIEEYKLKNNL